MPKYYCDYCDVFLTHDSSSVRKAHNSGRNHLTNVRDYYAGLGHDKAQNIIDEITKMYESGSGPMGGPAPMRMPLPPQPSFGGRGPGGFGGGPPPNFGPPPGMGGMGMGMGMGGPPPFSGPPPSFGGPPPMGGPGGFGGPPPPHMSSGPSFPPPMGGPGDGPRSLPPTMNPERARALGLA